MRQWLVAGAVIESPTGLLLVRNRRRDGSFDWSPPGGVIDHGESLLEGLTREVEEETGLIVSAWSQKLYEIEAHAPDMGWLLRVEAWKAEAWSGELCCADPDGIVDEIEWVPHHHCEGRLEGVARWVAEPIVDWLSAQWTDERTYRYQINGAYPNDLVVTRI